jgi:hypothetical protein
METTTTYPVPGLKLVACPWCKRAADRYYLLVYDRDGVTELEVMCERCEPVATQFAQMHQSGISRFDILADFGYRGRDALCPNRPRETIGSGDTQVFECEALSADHPEIHARERARQWSLQLPNPTTQEDLPVRDGPQNGAS